MMRLADAGPAVQAAVALGLALIAAPVVRGATVALDDTLGRAWPFSLARCLSPATPGCREEAAGPGGRRVAGHVRTGRP